MNEVALKWRKAEFESRIFISFSIVGILCYFSFVWFSSEENNLVLTGQLLGIPKDLSLKTGYLLVAFMLMVSTFIRMWAGSHLSSDRIMSFKIQHDLLTVTGPFRFVRNPVYLADMIAYSAFSLCLAPVGLLLPLLIWLHYSQLIKYEEWMLRLQFGTVFMRYKKKTPRILPAYKHLFTADEYINEVYISYDGFRNNALYLLFIPGFIVASFTESLIHSIVIGLPAVADWAFIHTVKGVASFRKEEITGRNSLTRSKLFKKVLYSQSWEDPEMDLKAFEMKPDDVVFSITSGGCNVLALLTGNPEKIISLDLNPYQNFVLELKIAAFKSLSYNELLDFLGVLPCNDRIRLYHRLRVNMSLKSRQFWDQNTAAINEGIIHCGHFEGYMHLLKRGFNFLMGKSLFREMGHLKTRNERLEFYETKWNNWRWRLFTRFLLSRMFMSFLFDKAFFKQLEENFSFGAHFQSRIKEAVTRFPLDKNSFLHYIVTGNYHPDNLPVYLQKKNYEIICSRLYKIELVDGDCLEYFLTLPDNSISCFNFTNIFEWMPVSLYEAILKETYRVGRPGSILTYRNLLVPRSRPDGLARWIVPLSAVAEKLHQNDKSFMYRKYVVEQITK